MQSLDVISINIWQIIISLLNLVILFLIIKKFLYKPVKRMLSERQNTIQKQYDDAEQAKSDAMNAKTQYEEKLSAASLEADGIILSAVDTAKAREKEIIDVSTVLTEKVLEREISADDHKNLIDSFIDNIGEYDE